MQKQNNTIAVGISGIPRGYQFPLPNGNWLSEKHKQQISSISPRIKLIEIPAHKVKETDAREIEVLLAEGGNRIHYQGELDWEDYQKFFTNKLKWVQLCSTGFSDNITDSIVNGAVLLTNAPGLHTIPIAESVLAAMLRHAKNLALRQKDQLLKQWNQLKNDELHGGTVLIIGLGKIGKRIAKLCKAFDMKVIGTKRQLGNVDNVDKVFATTDLLNFLPQADYVVIAAPLTPQTQHMLNQEEFMAMKPSSYLINVGRGKIANERFLIKAIKENQISGAYLDVFAEEPLAKDSELWSLHNVLIVPHDSHSSPHIGDRMVDLFCKNLTHYIKGEALYHICNVERGY